ncbi:hypothetical protein CCS92_32990, partial [Methylobacterium radiotolerans]
MGRGLGLAGRGGAQVGGDGGRRAAGHSDPIVWRRPRMGEAGGGAGAQRVGGAGLGGRGGGGWGGGRGG